MKNIILIKKVLLLIILAKNLLSFENIKYYISRLLLNYRSRYADKLLKKITIPHPLRIGDFY